VIKQIFEKVAYERWSGWKIYSWLKLEINFYTRGNKSLTLAGVYRILDNTFYYGTFEYPRESGKWYQGKHQPLITQELFERARAQLKRDQIMRDNREFAFTKILKCGLCGSGVSGQEKYKQLKNGSTAKYIYYGCTRSQDRFCKNPYMREEKLISELLKIIDQVDINELGMKSKLEEEMKRFTKFQAVLGTSQGITTKVVDIRTYAKYLLREGSIEEKRELLINLKSRLIYSDGHINLA
jgi:hypothetical protein